MAKETKKFIVFANGTEAEVTAENGKYWICGDVQYRKMNAHIVDIREEAVPKKKKKAEEPVLDQEEVVAKTESPVVFEEDFDNIPDGLEF